MGDVFPKGTDSTWANPSAIPAKKTKVPSSGASLETTERVEWNAFDNLVKNPALGAIATLIRNAATMIQS